MTVKCIKKEYDLTVGKEYEVLAVECDGQFYRIVDDSDEDYLHDIKSFEIVKSA